MKQNRQKMVNPSLSTKCQEIILGSLLGDGSLKKSAHYQNARFSFRHSTIQKEYFFWKVKELKEISGQKCYWLQKPDGWGNNNMLRYQSLALPSLTAMCGLVSKGQRYRVRRRWLNQLTPLSLAVWWMDDGSIIGNGRKGVFCSESFSYKEHLILSQYFRKVWHIETTIAEKQKGLGKYRLWIHSTDNLQKFLRMILPYVPVESMLSKTLILYKSILFQQRWISEVKQLSIFSESAIDKCLLEKKKKWKNFRE